MIIKASQRAGGAQLGAHLLKAENEHVEVHEVRGFVADDVKGAMKEAQAVAKGTRCKQYLFSVSLNPPETESVSIDKFENALDRIEDKMGLKGQPRIVVFHEKEGRRHCHAVWSRIDADKMTAIPLPHFKNKLREIAKGLYLQHGWDLPRGFMDSKARDPHNFTLAEWQQAKRMGRDPAQLKALVQEAWALSDNGPAFTKALEERGLYLAKGDRRAHVAVTYESEVLSVARLIRKKLKEVTAKLGPADNLRSVTDTRAHIAEQIAPRLQQLLKVADAAKTREMQPLGERREAMAERHTLERQKMDQGQKMRSDTESRARAAKFRAGALDIWDRFTGKHSATRQENERDALNALRRDRTQRDDLVADQLRERRGLQREIAAVRLRHASRVKDLRHDLARQNEYRPRGENVRDQFRDAASGSPGNNSKPARSSPRESGRDAARPRGPDLGR